MMEHHELVVSVIAVILMFVLMGAGFYALDQLAKAGGWFG